MSEKKKTRPLTRKPSICSLSNAAGAHRTRQATRELVKACAVEGLTVPELDELFSLFVWNQGAGHFASATGPSQLFAACQLIKPLEEQGLPRDQAVKKLVKNFKKHSSIIGLCPATENQ